MTKIASLSLLFLSIVLNSSCATTKTIYIADTYVNCKGVSKQKCLQTKENKEDDWSPFYDTIEGFDYKEGFTHKIEVKVTKLKNPPADASNLHYKLIKVIYQEKSKSIKTMQSFDGKWKVSKLQDIESLTISPTLEINLETKNIYGLAGCNKYSAPFTSDSNVLSFDIPTATKMYCNHMNIEDAFFDCLKKTASYKVENNLLKLFTKEGKELLTCFKVEN